MAELTYEEVRSLWEMGLTPDPERCPADVRPLVTCVEVAHATAQAAWWALDAMLTQRGAPREAPHEEAKVTVDSVMDWAEVEAYAVWAGYEVVGRTVVSAGRVAEGPPAVVVALMASWEGRTEAEMVQRVNCPPLDVPTMRWLVKATRLFAAGAVETVRRNYFRLPLKQAMCIAVEEAFAVWAKTQEGLVKEVERAASHEAAAEVQDIVPPPRKPCGVCDGKGELHMFAWPGEPPAGHVVPRVRRQGHGADVSADD